MKKQYRINQLENQVQSLKQYIKDLKRPTEIIGVTCMENAAQYTEEIFTVAHEQYIKTSPVTIILMKHGKEAETVYMSGTWSLKQVKKALEDKL